jgi:hypothetical protein
LLREIHENRDFQEFYSHVQVALIHLALDLALAGGEALESMPQLSAGPTFFL